jgi:hypothetical protein
MSNESAPDLELLRAIANGEIYQHLTFPLRTPKGRTVYRHGPDTITSKVRPLEGTGLLEFPPRQGTEKVVVGLSDKGWQLLTAGRGLDMADMPAELLVECDTGCGTKHLVRRDLIAAWTRLHVLDCATLKDLRAERDQLLLDIAEAHRAIERLSQMLDWVRTDACTMCAHEVCSAHQPSEGVLLALKNEVP